MKHTAQSVFDQGYKNIEYIIIDGGSSDASPALIESYSPKLAYSISEKDDGVYNAMNKGINKAGGDYLLFLNSGDTFFSDNAVELLAAAADDEDFIYGDLVIRDEKNETVKHYADKLSFSYFITESLPHPATLIKASVFSKFGLFDEKLKIASDWELFTNAIGRNNSSYKHIDHPISIFSMGGVSTDFKNLQLRWQEREWVLKNKFGYHRPNLLNPKEMRKYLFMMLNVRFPKLVNKLRTWKSLRKK